MSTSGPWHGRNHDRFDDPAVVADYAGLNRLTDCEERLVDRHVRVGARVLDLGVGTGRTTPALRSRAGRYVGLDYSASMIEAARATHPDAELVVDDASDLHRFGDAEFDVVVFSYNGLDYLHPVDSRQACLRECHRVLAPGGTLILSSHEPRALLAGPPGNPRSPRWWATRALIALRRARRHLPARAFWVGEGYVLDAARGGLLTFMTSRRRFRRAALQARFEVVEVVADRPATFTLSPWIPWWYYVLRRTADGTDDG